MAMETLVKDKNELVKEIVKWHVEIDPEITEIYRFISANEDAPDEPVKLLEVTGSTFDKGQVDFFGFSSGKDIPYPTVFGIITPGEYQKVVSGEIPLEGAWGHYMREKIYP